MKTRVVVFLAALLLVVFVVWLNWQDGTQEPGAVSKKVPTDSNGRASNRPEASPAATSTKTELVEMWRRFEIDFNKSALDSAVATGDPYKWRPLMMQALHYNLPREKGIALLQTYLSHPDAQVRAAAAQYLFKLGSRAGGPVLVAFLNDAAGGRRVDVDLVNGAAVLHQYRYPIDADLVYAAYQKNRSSRLLMYAQLLGSELAIPETRARLKSHGFMDGGIMMAGIMRLNDPDSLAIYELNFKSDNAERREAAAAALYRVTGKAEYLDYLIAIAEAKVDLRPRSGSTIDGSQAIRVLQQLVVPETTQALMRIESAARKNRHEVEANRALLGLYYFHRAYDYVDSLIIAQFTGKLPEGLLIGSIWDLARARGKPEIEAAAKAYNREAYEREFLRKAGRPVESWIFQYIPSEIPSYVRPPLKE